MSVVRKYQSGGQVKENDTGLENYLAEYVNSNKFTRKATPLAQQSAKAILELHKSGTLEKALKFDPVTQKYTVDLNEIPEEKQQFFKGSPDIKNKSNVFGQVKDNQESINEAILTEYYNYKQKSLSKVELPKATSSGITRSIKPLQDFIVDTEFSGDSASFQRYLESLGSEEAAQKYITDLGKKHLLSYQEQKDQNLLRPEQERDVYTDIPSFNEILNSVNLGYSDFSKNALHLGWDLNSIINPEFWERTRVNNMIDNTNSIINTGNEINAGINLQEKQNKEYLESLGIVDQQTQTVNENILTTNVPDYSWLKNIGKEKVEDKATYLNELANHVLTYKPSETDIRKLAYIVENQEDLSDEDKEKLQILLDNIRKSNKYKEGGVIKFQDGGKNISSDELRKKLQNVEIKVAKNTTLKNITRDPLSKETALSTLSVAGDIGSFVPGFGAIGGLVTTFADALKGGTDIKGWEEEDTKKLAANLGFTALALVGFGGVKSLLKASKLADKAVDVSKISGLSEDFIKLTNTIKNPTPKVLTGIIENIDKTKGGKAIASKILGEVTPETTKALKLTLSKDLGKIIQNTEPKMIEKVNSMAMKALDNSFTKSKGVSKLSPFIRTTVGLGVVADAAGSVSNAVSSGNIGNLTIEDTGNILRSGMLTKNFFNDRTLKNLLKKETEFIPKKSVVSIKEGENKPIKTLLEGDLPKMRNKLIFKKPDSKEIIAKYNTVKGKNIPSTATVKVEKEVPEQLVSKKQLSEKLTKILEKRGVLPKPIKLNKSKIKMSKTEKIDETVDKKEEGGILKFKNGNGSWWDKFIEWNTLSKGSPTISVGGPKIKAGTINVPEKTKWRMPIQPFPVGMNVQKQATVGSETPKNEVQLPISENIVPRVTENLTLIQPKTLESLPSTVDNKTLRQPMSSGDIIPDKNNLLNKLKGIGSKIDYTDLSNSAMYINTLAANNKISRAQRAAAMEGIVKLPTISNQYFRSSAKFAPFYDIQANKVRSLGKNLSGSISDIDKGFGVRLAAEQQAQETVQKGQQLDQQQIAKDIERQQTSDRQTELQNLGIVGQNLQSLAGARKAINLIDANKIMASSTALNNLITSYNRNKEVKDYRKRAEDLYSMSTSPEIKGIQDRWNTTVELEKEAKQKFLDRIKSDSSTIAEGDWENSPEYLEIKAMREGLLEESKPIQEKISAAKYAMQYGLPIKRAKGGTLAEKKYLIDLKHQQKKELEEQKHYYKMILKDNELLMKSLIKVFK